MKSLICILTILAPLIFCSCKNNKIEEHSNPHEVIIDDYQAAQLKFKNLVGTIRDPQSYDVAAPKLDEVVSEFERLAADLSKLTPPDEELRAAIIKKIEKGNKASEPTGEDMISLATIEGREQQVQNWLNKFVSSGQKVGIQFARLYYKTN